MTAYTKFKTILIHERITERREIQKCGLRLFLYGKEMDRMAQVFCIERNKNFTVMNNHHFKNKDLLLKAKRLLSLMLSLPECGGCCALGIGDRRIVKIFRNKLALNT